MDRIRSFRRAMAFTIHSYHCALLSTIFLSAQSVVNKKPPLYTNDFSFLNPCGSKFPGQLIKIICSGFKLKLLKFEEST